MVEWCRNGHGDDAFALKEGMVTTVVVDYFTAGCCCSRAIEKIGCTVGRTHDKSCILIGFQNI